MPSPISTPTAPVTVELPIEQPKQHPLSYFISLLTVLAVVTLLVPRSLAAIADFVIFSALHFGSRYLFVLLLLSSNSNFARISLASWCLLFISTVAHGATHEVIHLARELLLAFVFAPETCLLYLTIQTYTAIQQVGANKTVVERMWTQFVSVAVCVFLLASEYCCSWSHIIFQFSGYNGLPIAHIVFCVLLSCMRWKYCDSSREGADLREHVLPCIVIAGLSWLCIAAVQGIHAIILGIYTFVIIEHYEDLALHSAKWLHTLKRQMHLPLSMLPKLELRSAAVGFAIAMLLGALQCLWIYKYLKRRFQETYVTTMGLECPICYQNQRDVALLPCGHLFCSRCVDKVLPQLQQKDSCPLCRQKTTSKCKVFLHA